MTCSGFKFFSVTWEVCLLLCSPSAWLHWVWRFCSVTTHKPERQFGKPRNLSTWTINNTISLLQVFYSHLVQCDNKNLTYCLFKPFEFVLPFNIWANYSLRQLHSTICLPRSSSYKPQHTGTTLFCRCLWSLLASSSISWWWCHDPKLTQQHFNGWALLRWFPHELLGWVDVVETSLKVLWWKYFSVLRLGPVCLSSSSSSSESLHWKLRKAENERGKRREGMF